jgi:hypothetical protein
MSSIIITSGPQEDPAKALNVGVAAHITAASAGGPRYNCYNPDLPPEERSASSNGYRLVQLRGKKWLSFSRERRQGKPLALLVRYFGTSRTVVQIRSPRPTFSESAPLSRDNPKNTQCETRGGHLCRLDSNYSSPSDIVDTASKAGFWVVRTPARQAGVLYSGD